MTEERHLIVRFNFRGEEITNMEKVVEKKGPQIRAFVVAEAELEGQAGHDPSEPRMEIREVVGFIYTREHLWFDKQGEEPRSIHRETSFAVVRGEVPDYFTAGDEGESGFFEVPLECVAETFDVARAKAKEHAHKAFSSAKDQVAVATASLRWASRLLESAPEFVQLEEKA